MPTNQPELHGLVRYDTSAKKVVLQWRSRFQGQMITLDDQTESTSYWPTEVAPFGPNRLLVAGKDPIRHSTVIELWTFNEFQELPVPELDSESGKLKRPVIRQRVNRQPVYDAAVVGRDMVRVLFYNRGDGSALCQFHDSRDLYSLDTATGALEKILSANPDPQQPEVEVVPRLGDDYADRRCAKHLQYGYIYTLGYPANYTDDPSLYLFDLDLDGEIDEVHVVDGPTWRSLGLGDGAQYVEYYY